MSDDPNEPSIPRSALNKLIKDSAPGFRIANETRDLLYSCCMEFVKMVSSQANKVCAEEQKKTITHEHTLKAFNELGFGAEYHEAASSVLGQCKEAAQKRQMRLSSRLENCGVPVEELEKQQAELFEKARIEQAEIEQAQVAWFLEQRELALQKEKMDEAPKTDAAEKNFNTKALANGIPLDTTMQQTPNLPGTSSSALRSGKLSLIRDLDEDYDND